MCPLIGNRVCKSSIIQNDTIINTIWKPIDPLGVLVTVLTCYFHGCLKAVTFYSIAFLLLHLCPANVYVVIHNSLNLR